MLHLDEFKRIPFLAFLVGGAVRDSYLGIPPVDYDLATPRTPKSVMNLCHRAGISAKLASERYGVVVARLGGEVGEVEITTFRSDFNPDGRNCMTVPVTTIERDLARRDFTVNAIAVNIQTGEVIDPYGGRKDCESRVLRFVGRPEKRLEEDLLRGLRGLRLGPRLGLKLDPILRTAIYESRLIDELRKATNSALGGVLTVERVVSEIEKAFAAPNIKPVLQYLWDFGIIHALIPELDGADALIQNPKFHPEGDVWSHTKEVVDQAPVEYRWPAFFHDIGKPMTALRDTKSGYWSFKGHDKVGLEVFRPIAERLKFSKKLTAECCAAIEFHMMPYQITTERGRRRFHARVGKQMPVVQAVSIADCMGRKPPNMWAFEVPPEPIEPVLSGYDLMNVGVSPGPFMGECLQRAFEYQIDTGCTDKETLCHIALTRAQK